MEHDEDVEGGEDGGIVRNKSAYMYFQTMNSAAIKEELLKEGADTAFGAMGSAISARWKVFICSVTITHSSLIHSFLPGIK